MPIEKPTFEQVREVANRLGFRMADSELQEYFALMQDGLAAYQVVDAMPEKPPTLRYPRQAGYRPTPGENRYGAWYRKTTVKGASQGKLAGKRIVLKDNVCLADVPMAAGTSILEGYTPSIDATIVTRILDAGGEIVGKSVCENFSFSGGSHTSATGPVHNPRKPGYSAGGSSSGSAALVAAGEVDMAIGGDQGGSIRIPSSYCGVCGMKPTYGLVPYTGILSIEFTVDHTGPITANVADNALLLEVIAGDDGIDPRQRGARPDAYTNGIDRGAAGLRVAELKEGFTHANSDSRVNASVRAAAECLGRCGAQVDEVSVPSHATAAALLVPILAEGALDAMRGNGFPTNQKGLHLLDLMHHLSSWRERADELPVTMKTVFMLGAFLQQAGQGRFYAKAQNLGRELRAAYDVVLSQYDLLLMPTLPITASKLPEPHAGKREIYDRALEMLPNTSPFDITGHPAMSIPCGTVEGLPVGLMLVGRPLSESLIYRAAFALEKSANWQTSSPAVQP
jgi:amidase